MFITEEAKEAFTEDVKKDRVNEFVKGLQEGVQEVTSPGVTWRGGALEYVVVGFIRGVAGGAAVVVACMASMEAIASG